MKKYKDIPLEYIKDRFYFDEALGHLFRKKDGKRVGRVKLMPSGYKQESVSINGSAYVMSRVLWSLYHDTPCPTDKMIDHIDRNSLNHRKDNIRLATAKVNARNRGVGSNNESGVNGVTWCRTTKIWKISIGTKRLGVRASFFEAVCRRKSAENREPHYRDGDKIIERLTNARQITQDD